MHQIAPLSARRTFKVLWAQFSKFLCTKRDVLLDTLSDHCFAPKRLFLADAAATVLIADEDQPPDPPSLFPTRRDHVRIMKSLVQFLHQL